MNVDNLSIGILRVVDTSKEDSWMPCNIAELRNRLSDFDKQLATAGIGLLVDSILELGQSNQLLISKSTGGNRASFDFQRSSDKGYLSNFFARDYFDLKITLEGRRRISPPSSTDEILREVDSPFPEESYLDSYRNQLKHQIQTGEDLRSVPIVEWDDLEVLGGKVREWMDYTVELFKFFDESSRATEFRKDVMRRERMSGDLSEWTAHQRGKILDGLTYLRSLHNRLPLIWNKSSRNLTSTKALNRDAEVVCSLLKEISSELANQYEQVRADAESPDRISFRGTANELREMLREVLKSLATDDVVRSQTWFHSETQDGKPTHQQRARFIIQSKHLGEKTGTVVSKSLTVLEEGLSQLVRNLYNRASAATHVSKDAEEIRKLLRYFDALMHDLIGKEKLLDPI